MSSHAEHCRIDAEELGLSRAYPEVHNLLDQFAHFPDWEFLKVHRQFLHHEEGVKYIEKLWGNEAAAAAIGHIFADMGHLPHAVDFYNGTLDGLGLKAERRIVGGTCDPANDIHAMPHVGCILR